MRYIHNAKITVFLKPEEYAGDVKFIQKAKDMMHSFIPVDFVKEKLSITEEDVESFENRKIRILALEISKEAHTNIFLKTLKELLKGQCRTVASQKESRLDEELCFYIRLDKESMQKGIVELTDSGDCVHIKMHIAAYPKNRIAALKIVEEIFS